MEDKMTRQEKTVSLSALVVLIVLYSIASEMEYQDAIGKKQTNPQH